MKNKLNQIILRVGFLASLLFLSAFSLAEPLGEEVLTKSHTCYDSHGDKVQVWTTKETDTESACSILSHDLKEFLQLQYVKLKNYMLPAKEVDPHMVIFAEMDHYMLPAKEIDLLPVKEIDIDIQDHLINYWVHSCYRGLRLMKITTSEFADRETACQERGLSTSPPLIKSRGYRVR